MQILENAFNKLSICGPTKLDYTYPFFPLVLILHRRGAATNMWRSVTQCINWQHQTHACSREMWETNLVSTFFRKGLEYLVAPEILARFQIFGNLSKILKLLAPMVGFRNFKTYDSVQVISILQYGGKHWRTPIFWNYQYFNLKQPLMNFAKVHGYLENGKDLPKNKIFHTFAEECIHQSLAPTTALMPAWG